MSVQNRVIVDATGTNSADVDATGAIAVQLPAGAASEATVATLLTEAAFVAGDPTTQASLLSLLLAQQESAEETLRELRAIRAHLELITDTECPPQ